MSLTYYSRPDNAFSDLYIDVRKKEKRFFTEAQIAQLPDLKKNHPLYQEWQMRKKSAGRFINYLQKKNKPLKILDIGCGNGWFSHWLSHIDNSEVIGLDVNIPELEQAINVFQKTNLSFVYADLYENTLLNIEKFDIIVFNSCFQYFEDAKSVIGIVSNLLSETGEIHIIDTPFYKREKIEAAKRRTKSYYESIGFPDMAKHYFHHRFNDLDKYTILYRPNILSKLLKNDSPFYWIKIDAI